MVEQGFSRIRVRGELSGVKRAASGHIYCGMKDDTALIDAVIWKSRAARLSFLPEDGIEIIALGRLTTYPARSKYQLVIESMEIAGEGTLMLLFEKLKARLRSEGLFDRPKQALPVLPRVIAVVTSPSGAVIRDIVHRLAARCPAHVLLWPVRVQGEGAAEQIAAALRGLDALSAGAEAPRPAGAETPRPAGAETPRPAGAETPRPAGGDIPRPAGGDIPRPDLVIIARGGGSIEDLWAFNEEIVVRAIAECRLPVISAVGHETDVTLADHAADCRAPTPTAAAEMVMPVRADLLMQLSQFDNRMLVAVRRRQRDQRQKLESLARFLPGYAMLYGPQRQRLDDTSSRLERTQRQRLFLLYERLSRRKDGLRVDILRRRIAMESARLGGFVRLLESLNPAALLSRGYAMVRDGSDTLITSAAAARKAEVLRLIFADGDVILRADADADVTLRAGLARAGKPAKPVRTQEETDSLPKGQGELF